MVGGCGWEATRGGGGRRHLDEGGAGRLHVVGVLHAWSLAVIARAYLQVSCHFPTSQTTFNQFKRGAPTDRGHLGSNCLKSGEMGRLLFVVFLQLGAAVRILQQQQSDLCQHQSYSPKEYDEKDTTHFWHSTHSTY